MNRSTSLRAAVVAAPAGWSVPALADDAAFQAQVEELRATITQQRVQGLVPNTPPLGVEIGQDLDVFTLRTQFSC